MKIRASRVPCRRKGVGEFSECLFLSPTFRLPSALFLLPPLSPSSLFPPSVYSGKTRTHSRRLGTPRRIRFFISLGRAFFSAPTFAAFFPSSSQRLPTARGISLLEGRKVGARETHCFAVAGGRGQTRA